MKDNVDNQMLEIINQHLRYGRSMTKQMLPKVKIIGALEGLKGT